MKKLKNLLRRWKKSSGFTLVELVISCGLLGILVVGITAFIGPVLRSVAENEENVRAKLLSQTIDEYVTRSTRDAFYVAIFTDAKKADTASGGSIATSENIQKMMDFVKKNDSFYELKCFSYRWTEVPQSGEQKYMLMAEKFVKGTTVLEDNPIPVFENCFYDGLFPDITMEVIEVTNEAADSSTEGESDGEKPKVAAAIKTTYTINTSEDSTVPGFVGIGYTEYWNLRSDAEYNKTMGFKFYGIESMGSGEEHPMTYIYYVARKPTAFDISTSSSSSTT